METFSSYVYSLTLPKSMKCHPVFHIFLVKSTASDPLERQKPPPPPLTIVDNTIKLQVEGIDDSKL